MSVTGEEGQNQAGGQLEVMVVLYGNCSQVVDDDSAAYR